MLVKIKNSALLKYLCFYLILSFVAISCDSKGTLLTSAKIDKEVEKQMSNFGGNVSKEDCEKTTDMMNALKSYVLLKHSDGIYVSNSELMDYSLSYGQQKGYIKDLSDEAKNALVNIANAERYISGDQSHDQLLNIYEDMGRFSHECTEILRTFQNAMKGAQNAEDAHKIIQNTEDVVIASGLSNDEKSSLDNAFNSARQILCTNPSSEASFSEAAADRGWVLECITTAVWTFHLVSVILFVAAFFIALITFGLASWIAVAIAVTVCNYLAPQGAT
jgi:VIT1/CCC1 family predicted Fe2+/Mn2+ transporter